MSGFSLSSFFFETGLYQEVKVEETNFEKGDFRHLFSMEWYGNFDGFNPFKSAESSFSISKCLNDDKHTGYQSHDMSETTRINYRIGYSTVGRVEIRCERFHDLISFLVSWNYENKILTKLGQSVPHAEFHRTDLDRFKKVESDDVISELKKAVALFSHDVGIGSFVYLRRVFERLVTEAYEKAKKDESIDLSGWNGSRMLEKVKMLERFLPDYFVKNRSLYSILSSGIHEYDEQTCLSSFSIVLDVVEAILEERLVEKNRIERAEIASKNLQKLNQKLKGNGIK